jgi:hypothetical protein
MVIARHSGVVKTSEQAFLFSNTYSSVPNRRACTFINFEKKKSALHGLILVCTFIDFEKKFPPARLLHTACVLVFFLHIY